MNEKPRRFRFGLITLFALIAAAGVLACFWNPFPKPSQSNLSLIEVGMTVDEVAELVGEPDKAETDNANGRLAQVYWMTRGEAWIVVFVNGKVTACDQFWVSAAYPPP
jgi:hypothetical protein